MVLAPGCSRAPSIEDTASAEAAAVDAGVAPDPTIPTTPPTALPTIDVILSQDRFIPLSVALERSGLREMIDAQDEFVLLAPIGAAFASSAADTGIEYSLLMNNAGLLEAIMRYHIVVGTPTGREWRTLNGASLSVDGSNPHTVGLVDGIEVLEAISTRNGTVLVIPRLLVPLSEPVDTSASGASD